MTTTLHGLRGLRAHAALLATAALGAVACDAGPGSERGPALPTGPAVSGKVVVLDDAGRGVAGAVVTTGDARAVTGRNGRGDLQADVRGARRVAVAATAAKATDGDRLGDLAVALDVLGLDLPEVLHLPDLRVGAVVPAGVQSATTVVAAGTGESLTIAAGANVAPAAAVAVVDVRLGTLQPQHLPGALPTPASAAEAFLFTRAVCIAPVDVAFQPALDLAVPDQLDVGGSAATPALFRLDPVTGAWTQVAATVTAAAGTLTAAAAVAGGGVYVFGAPCPAGVVSGRVVDAATPTPAALAGVLVRVDQGKTVTDELGRYSVARVAVATPNGAARSANVEAFAGGDALPVRAAAAVALQPGATAAADLVLDTRPAGTFAVQQIRRGRAPAFGALRVSALRGGVAVAAVCDATGVAVLEDVPTGYVGFRTAVPVDASRVTLGQAVRFFDGGRFNASYCFLEDRLWIGGGRGTAMNVCDELGGGPLERADVVQGNTPAQGFLAETLESGVVTADRNNISGRATATLSTQRGGDLVVHAYSVVGAYGDRLELPLQVARPQPVGAFDRFGIVGGLLDAADPTRGHAVRATRRLSAQDWWDARVEGLAVVGAMPVAVDPAVVGSAYAVGVPAQGGNVAVVEYAEAAGAPAAPRTLAKAGLLADVAPTEGAVIERTVELAAADATFVVAEALVGAPPELDVAALTVGLALQRADGFVVDVADGLTGNHVAAGADLVFTLPALAGDRADATWLARLDGTFPQPDGTRRGVTSLVSLPRGAGATPFPRGAVRFQPFPTLAFPTPGAVVPPAGFTALFALPPGARHAFVELRNVPPDPDPDPTASETLRWTAFVPPTSTSFAFVALPTDVATPLRAGKDYELTVTACFGDDPSAPTYESTAAYLQSIGALERGVVQLVRTSVRFRTE